MEGLYLGGSLVAAFLGGAVALFAPCCIVVLFPSYLAAAVRNQRWRLVPLTFVFASGIAVVLVPVTLGLSILTQGLARFHGAVYVVGGAVMLILAVVALSGRGWALPIMRGSPDIQRTDSGGVFVLGVFSGAASACCAPVLAGVLTLSAVAPSALQGLGIGMAYVFGMVFPLVIMAALWDRLGTRGRVRLQGRRRTLRLAGRTVTLTTLDIVSAGVYAVMGVALVVIGIAGTSLAPSGQAAIGAWIEARLTPLVRWLDPIPDVVVGLGLVALAIGAVVLSGRRRNPDTANQETVERSCHDQHEDTREDTIVGAD